MPPTRSRRIGVRRLINVQFAIGAGVLYVLEGRIAREPHRAFRREGAQPAVAKAASLIMVGQSIRSLVESGMLPPVDGSVVPMDSPVAVRRAVLPFKRFRTAEG
jgi:carbamoyl-phosphate synthase large subunit